MSESAAGLFPAFPREDYANHEAEIAQALRRTLESGCYILGPEVEKFEAEFAGFACSRFAIGVANGTDAIELLLRAHGIGEGHQVIVPSHTAVATVAAVVRAGAEPVFADIDPARYTLLPEGLRQAIKAADSTRLKATIAVHLYGQPAAMDSLRDICRGAGIRLFEDCAQAHGATIGGRSVGALADGGSFSFYPTKNLGALGDGGAVVTDDPEIERAVRELRQYGWRSRYISETVGGINSRLDEMQAAILRAKLPSLPGQIVCRRKLAALYRKLLSDIPELRLPTEFPGSEHAYHLFVIRAERRDELLAYLTGKEIPAALHYPAAVHQQPAYENESGISPALPHTEIVLREIVTLPLHSHLSEKAVEVTSALVRKFFNRQ